MQAIRSVLSAAALLLVLQACAPTPPRPSPAVEADIALAISLQSRGDHVAAAAKYQEMARKARSPFREDLLMRAAGALLQAGEASAASSLLAAIDTRALAPALRQHHRVLMAQAALAEGRDDRALEILAAPLPPDASLELRRRYHEQRAQSYLNRGRAIESAEELAQLDYWLDDRAEKLAGQLTIIERLTLAPSDDLKALQPLPPDDFAGWIELASILRQTGGYPQEATPLIWAWRARFPNHPALKELPDAWFDEARSRTYQPRQIAVLLPETGRFRRVGAALREGILAAYFSQPPEQRPELRFFDSSDVTSALQLVRQAVAGGADLILGPLDKEAVAQLLRAGEMPVPVLALNRVQLEVPSPGNLYQFALAPEDEAEQVAERAWSQGYSRALVLTPDEEWGERLFQGFRDRWESLGGRILEHGVYDPKEHDFSRILRGLLNLDESEDRRQQLQRLLARNLGFEPRRRRDAEFVFLAARPQQGRAIRPQLQFHHAADLPVFATSHIYTGQHSVVDRDLEGVWFPDLPWMLGNPDATGLSRQRLATTLPDNDDRFARLTAMGIDSYRLIPILPRLKANPQDSYEGTTGTLSVDSWNQVRRRLVWAQFRAGAPSLGEPEPVITEGEESESAAPRERLPAELEEPRITRRDQGRP